MGKKLLIGLTTGISAFLVGLVAYGSFIFNESISSVDAVPNDKISINSCSLIAHSDQLINKPIVVDALLFQNYEGISVYPKNGMDCGKSDPDHGYLSSNWDPSIFTVLDLTDYVSANSDIGQLFATSKKKSEIDVQIEGFLIRSASKNFPLRYKLVPTKIKLLSAWRPFRQKGAA